MVDTRVMKAEAPAESSRTLKASPARSGHGALQGPEIVTWHEP